MGHFKYVYNLPNNTRVIARINTTSLFRWSMHADAIVCSTIF